MRLATFVEDGQASVAVVSDRRCLPLDLPDARLASCEASRPVAPPALG
jgi:hypothetical protein